MTWTMAYPPPNNSTGIPTHNKISGIVASLVSRKEIIRLSGSQFRAISVERRVFYGTFFLPTALLRPEATCCMAIDGAFPVAIVPVLGIMFGVIIALYALAFDQPEEDTQ
jgi:hypothetical protein